MKYTKLGKTGLVVSRIALGCMSYGSSKWRPWVLDERDAAPFFKRAIEAGINFFDTSNMYSLGVSEEVTGRALREFARLDEVVIATKVGLPMGEGPNMRGLSRKHVVQSCEASLKRLGVETIDLFQLHRFDPETPIEETLSALDLLVRQGKVRYVGASSTYAWRFAKALAAAEKHGFPRFVSMQNHYNLIYREEEREMNPLCVSEGIGLIPWSPLARGLLAGTRTSLTDTSSTVRAESDAPLAGHLYDSPNAWEIIEVLKKVAAERGVAPARVALAWLLRKPGVAAPIVGATKPAHLEDAIASVDIELTADECKLVEAPYKPHEVRGWL
jgi:1-deoxyxylulose-5-phosphate synthase